MYYLQEAFPVMKNYLLLLLLLISTIAYTQPQVIVLGVAQDGGYPHIGCMNPCCQKAHADEKNKRYVVALALVDPAEKKWWLFEATPDFSDQLYYFRTLTDSQYNYLPDGIFISHAHIGHYTGLMELGREALGAKSVPVYALPNMKNYLEQNGPWSQLVSLNNIKVIPIDTAQNIRLSSTISVNVFTVPHRDEFSETAGFKISADKTYLFIPDINKWQLWYRDIKEELAKVDIAFLDATFYNNEELPGRRMEEVPHPFVAETTFLLQDEKALLNKIHFIHLNHTNPLLWNNEERNKFQQTGAHIAVQGARY